MEKLFGIPLDTLMLVFLAAFAAVVGVLGLMALRSPVIFKIGVRNIPRRRSRTVLIVLGLMLGTLIIAAAFATGDTMTHTVRSTVLDSLGTVDEVISTQRGDDTPFVDERTVPSYFPLSRFEAVRQALAGNDAVDGVAPAISEQAAVVNSTRRQNEPRVALFATDPAYAAGFNPIVTADGEKASLDALAPGEVYINREGADKLGAKPGDELIVFAAGTQSRWLVKAIVDYKGTLVDGPSVLLPLAQAQQTLQQPGQINAILISNRGGALSGVDHTAAVTAKLEPLLEGTGLQVHPAKEDALDQADQAGDAFTSVFVVFGLFSIGAGILLIFLIFVMLAAERQAEMGIARAVGTQRRQLIQMFLFEGIVYDLAAAAIGALLGVVVAFGMVRVMAAAFGTVGLEIAYDFKPRSLIVAYTIGVLFTFIVVGISAWRVSALNIVQAIRDLPEPKFRRASRRTLYLGIAGIALGALLAFAGVASASAPPFYLGTSLMVIGLVPVLRRFAVPERIAYTLAGLLLLAWWLDPIDVFDPLLPEMSSDISMFFLSGIMLVLGAVWVAIFNSDLLLTALVRVFGRFRQLAPVLKMAIAYPMTNRFRTGMTLAMFSLVVFTLVVMAILTSSFTDLLEDEESFSGGFDIRGTVNPSSPIADVERAVTAAPQLNAGDFEVIASQSRTTAEVRQAGVAKTAFADYPLRGMDSAFLEATTFRLAIRASGYGSDQEVWQALKRDPSLAVVDAAVVPARSNFNVGGGLPDFRLEGFFYEDETMPSIEVEVRNPQTGRASRLTIIGVLEFSSPTLGIFASQQGVADLFGADARPAIYLFKLRPGVDAKAVAAGLEDAFLENGMEAVVLRDELAEFVGINRTVNYMLQGFMALGLMVGIAALGVISARSVVERRQQIGVLRSIGFQKGMVQLSFLLESSFVAVLSIIIGLALGVALSINIVRFMRDDGVERLSLVVPWLNIAIIFAMSYGFSLLMTFLPARQASRIYPAEALRYE